MMTQLNRLSRFCSLLLMLATCLGLGACSRKTGPLVSSMHTEGLHHKWRIIQTEGISDTSSVFIDLRDVYRSGATAGCQYFSFTPKFGHNNRMQMAGIARHFMPCADDQRDQLLRAGLASVYSFSLTGDHLKLLARDGRVIFSAERSADDENNSLRRKWWIQQMINANNELLTESESILDLTELTKAAGTVGCNKFLFQAVADDTYHIAISNIAATKMYCQGPAENESVFSKVLPLVNKYQVIGNTLRLFDKDNALLLEAKGNL